MMHYNVPKVKEDAYFARLNSEKRKVNKESRNFIEDILYTDVTYTAKLDYWKSKVTGMMSGKDFWTLDDIFPEKIYPALDLMMGEKFRKQFLQLCERMTRYPYTEGYYRRMIRSKNYRHHFDRITRRFFSHFITCYIMGYDVNTMLNQDFQDDVKQELSDHYALEIDCQNEEVINKIKDIILSDNNTGIITHYVIQAVIQSENRELLKLLEQLLLAAKLQEGIRQAICESIDCGLQENFVHFFDVIYNNNLVRFSSVKRAIATFIGIGESFGERLTKKELEIINDLNHDSTAADVLIHSDDNVEATLGLWKKGSEDITSLVEAVYSIFEHGKRHSHLLISYYLNVIYDDVYSANIARKVIRMYCADDETFEKENGLEVLACYISHLFPIIYYDLASDLENNNIRMEELFADKQEAEEIFTCLERGMLSMKTKESVFSPCIFPWYSVSISKHNMARSMAICTWYLKGAYKETMADYMKFLEWDLGDFLKLLYGKLQSRKQKDMAIELLGNRNINTKAVYEVVKNNNLVDEYIDVLEGYLRLKTPEIRQAVIELLYSQNTGALKQSIERLIIQKDVQKRLGALDLLLRGKNEDKVSDEEIKNFIDKIMQITTAEQVLIDTLLSKNDDMDSGFYDAEYEPEIELTLTAKVDLKKLMVKKPEQLYETLKKLSELCVKHENYEYKTAYGNEVLLRDNFTSTDKKHMYSGKDMLECYPLAEVWLDFYEKEIGDFKVLNQLYIMLKIGDADIDSEEFSDYFDMAENLMDDNLKRKRNLYKFLQKIFGRNLYKLSKKLKTNPIAYCGEKYKDRHVIYIIEKLYEREKKNHKDECIAIAKSVFSIIMKKFNIKDLVICREYWGNIKNYDLIFDENPMLAEWMEILDHYDNDMDFKEIFSFKYNIEKGIIALAEDTNISYDKTELYLSEVAYAIRRGMVEKDFFYRKVLSPNPERADSAVSVISGYITGEIPNPNLRGYNEFVLSKETVDFIKELGGRAIEYIVGLEIKRGDMPLTYSKTIHSIKRIEGIEKMIAVLKAMGNLKLDRNSWYFSGGDSKQETLSHLLKISYPSENDNAQDLKKLLGGTDITEQRLTEVAMYSPQWIPIFEEYLGWKGLAGGCYYFHAHTSDVDKRKEGLFAKYTPISIDDLRDGAFDVSWFNECYKDLGEEKFDMLYKSAKYISDGSKHSRARKFADAVLGKLKVKETEREILDKRNKDLLTAYGLIPLAKDKNKDLLNRYKFLQKFLKESKQFGAQRRNSEAKAFQIALENLARNAGYSDVTRLTWLMETALIDEIKEYFTPKALEDVAVYIDIDENGKSEIICEKAGKKLKSIPTKLKKNSYVEEIKLANKNLKDQYNRSKKMLEEAMEEGIVFYSNEIDILQNQNPVISPLLKNLVMKSDDKLGYYKDEALYLPDGKHVNLESESQLVIAHALDLYNSGKWHEFQQDLFERKIRQPFKQVFRELYVKTEDEQGKYETLRYAGHQIQPQKTVAVLKSRRWVIDDQEGLQKVYYKNNIIAKIYALADWYSPADVEAPTLEWVKFFDRKNFEPIMIDEIPDLIFTEVMRDVDLAVSIAHVGGVDPETSHSTIEMRKAIVEFNLPLFKIKNVNFTEKHALITGKLAEYSIHLGSGLVHQKAGSVINVLPVHSQHRGKIFLPFLDEDPKTAEIMAKVILFANDEKIKDPSIFNQIIAKKS